MANKRLLLIFNDNIDTYKFTGLISDYGFRQVDLFPLTGDLSIVQGIEGGLSRQYFDNVLKYNTSAMVDNQIAAMRKKICRWSADIGECRVEGKRIKEWFFLSKCNISSWWFSLFAEKNPFKTDIFLEVAQACAVKELLSKNKYELAVLAINNGNLRTAIKNIAVKRAVPIKLFPVVHKKTCEKKFKEFVRDAGLGIKIIRGFKLAFNILRSRHLLSRYLPLLEKRFHDERSILFISYFPLIEKTSAQNGVFKNRYALVLQDKLKEVGLPITWVLLYVPVDGFNLKDSINLAKKFIANGEKIFFPEEFLDFKDIAYGLCLWLRQVFIGLFLSRFVKNMPVLGLERKEGRSFMKLLWADSFYGPVGLEGILFTLSFKKMFKRVENIKDCLYYCEMQPWEHALNSAKNQEQSDIRSIGFQHSSIPNYSFNYFHERLETEYTDDGTGLPLPDIMGCDGEIMQDLLAASGYPGLRRLEALRYLYLDKVLSAPDSQIGKRRTLLIAGSGDKEESIRLIMLVRSVFAKAGAFDICFKGHPSFPFEKLFNDLGIDSRESGYIIKHNDISNSLKEAFAVITLSSTVMIEALAFGCEVVVPIFPDFISLHPLVGFEKYYHKVDSPEGIKEIVQKIFNGFSLCSIREYRSFVRRYWDIDADIPRWSKLLDITDERKNKLVSS